jgi:thiol-disulfide isomerase/thioredoxin
VLAAPAERGQPVVWPEVALLGGGRFGPAQAAGQAVVVVFWSTTCPFCRRHNEHVEKLHRAAQAAGLPLTVLGVARERDAARVQRYAQQQGYSFAITLEHAPLAAALASRNMIPLTATVNRQGRLVEVIPGEMFEEDVLGLQKLARAERTA